MNNNKIKRMVGIAILSAIVVVLQLLGSFIKIGPVSICLVLVPIVVGAATYGPAAGAILAPVINTGIFFIGCRVFFWNTLASWGQGNALNYMLTVMIGFNFLAELGTNVVCSPIICRILKAAKH